LRVLDEFLSGDPQENWNLLQCDQISCVEVAQVLKNGTKGAKYTGTVILSSYPNSAKSKAPTAVENTQLWPTIKLAKVAQDVSSGRTECNDIVDR